MRTRVGGSEKWGHFSLPPTCIWKDHDLKLAREKEEPIADPDQCIVGQLGICGVKQACDFNGYYGGRARSPLLPVTALERSEIESLLTVIRN